MRLSVILLCIVLVFTFMTTSCLGTPSENPSAVTVPILMFHDVKSNEGGTWSISAENFKSTLTFLLSQGYTPVFFDDLVNFVDGTANLPDKPVVITLDDGYYSNYRYVLPIVTELEVPVTVFLTCGTVRAEEDIPSENENILCKMNLEELRTMQASPFVKIQSHSYALHGENTSYSDAKRDNVLPLDGEERDIYEKIFTADCALAEATLLNIGVNTQLSFSYPSGKQHAWAEEVLQDRGYRVTVTTDYSRRNKVVKGDKSSLFLLGRMNVNDDTTEEDLIQYLTRK